MLELTRNLGPTDAAVADRLQLDYASRCRARLKVRLESGVEAGLFLEYGRVLNEGDVLTGDDGVLVRVECKPEPVITARTEDRQLLARGCYHLGNRHASLQIGETWLRFCPDPVLEYLVGQLGFEVVPETAPFSPEPGAYAGHGQQTRHEGRGHHEGHSTRPAS
ncbi:MAG: urease accessory protein UreE [Desulfovibrio sp.]|jgi:urease accessory protein|nr:urease accessory protein UreE [Desulfovibrio sp.]